MPFATSTARYEELEEQRRQLAARRQVLEERTKLRLATTHEFGRLRVASLGKTKKAFTAQCAIAQKRNEDVLTKLYEAKDAFEKHAEAVVSARRLAEHKARFLAIAERMYPAWQEEQLRSEVEELHRLESARVEAASRRAAAREAFEKEMAVRAVVDGKRHELTVVQMQQQSEDTERQLLRDRRLKEARGVDRLIHAEAARNARDVRRNAALAPTPATPALQEALRGLLVAQKGPATADAATGTTAAAGAAAARGTTDAAPSFDFVDAFDAHAALDDSVRAHAEWLSQKFTSEAAAAAAPVPAAGSATVPAPASLPRPFPAAAAVPSRQQYRCGTSSEDSDGDRDDDGGFRIGAHRAAPDEAPASPPPVLPAPSSRRMDQDDARFTGSPVQVRLPPPLSPAEDVTATAAVPASAAVPPPAETAATSIARGGMSSAGSPPAAQMSPAAVQPAALLSPRSAPSLALGMSRVAADAAWQNLGAAGRVAALTAMAAGVEAVIERGDIDDSLYASWEEDGDGSSGGGSDRAVAAVMAVQGFLSGSGGSGSSDGVKYDSNCDVTAAFAGLSATALADGIKSLLRARATELVPLPALVGAVGLDKLRKAQRQAGAGVPELWAAFMTHVGRLVALGALAAPDMAAVFGPCFALPATAPAADRERQERKLAAVLEAMATMAAAAAGAGAVGAAAALMATAPAAAEVAAAVRRPSSSSSAGGAATFASAPPIRRGSAPGARAAAASAAVAAVPVYRASCSGRDGSGGSGNDSGGGGDGGGGHGGNHAAAKQFAVTAPAVVTGSGGSVLLGSGRPSSGWNRPPLVFPGALGVGGLLAGGGLSELEDTEDDF